MTPRNLILLSILNTVASGNMFAFCSKNTAWGSPDLPPSGELTDSQVLDEILFTKRIDNRDVRLMIDRITWSAGTSFLVGDIVVTSENKIYICTTAGTSVTAPTWVSGTQIESPGTVGWKFVSKISPEDDRIFSDPDKIPLNWDAETIFWTEKPVSIKISYQIVGDENSFFPLGQTYRITGLYANPFDRKPRNTPNASSFTDYGALVGIDTFEPISRTSEQSNRFTFEIALPN